MSEKAIIVDGVYKSFKLPHQKHSSVKSLFVNLFKGRRTYENQEALNNISLEINKGEFFGIVGRNGSGKSTLLKLLAGIYSPNKGNIQVNGKLTPFIELGVGFNPELTGRENVFLNGALLGFNRKEMGEMYDEIVEFAELERFMDQKLKNYSSGMQVRLAFSIAIRAQSEILLIDEVLAVGDMNFQNKCFRYFEELKKQGQTIVLVSHDMESIKKFCNRVALISNGKLRMVGSPSQVAKLYEEENKDENKGLSNAPTVLKGAKIKKLKVSGNKGDAFDPEEMITLRFEVEVEDKVALDLGVNIVKKDDGQFIAGMISQYQIKPQNLDAGERAVYEFVFPSAQFSNGTFLIDAVIYDSSNNQPIFFRPAMTSFKTQGMYRGWGALNLQGNWKIV